MIEINEWGLLGTIVIVFIFSFWTGMDIGWNRGFDERSALNK